MDYGLIAILPLVTFAVVIAFAIWSRRRTEAINHDKTSEKSSLAKDGPGPQPFR